MLRKVFYILVLAVSLVVSKAEAQNFIRGARLPKLDVEEWLDKKPVIKRHAVLLEFFSSANPVVMSHVDRLNEIADRFEGMVEVVIVTRDYADVIEKIFSADSKCFIALDRRGYVFENYGVMFVPCTVMMSKRGRMVWTGDPNELTDREKEIFIR